MNTLDATKLLLADSWGYWTPAIVQRPDGTMLTLSRLGWHAGVVIPFDEDESTAKDRVADFRAAILPSKICA